MIDWAQYDEDSEADWARLAGQIISAAQVAVQAGDAARMGEAADDIVEFASRSSFHKPDWATQALRRAQAQLTAARQGLAAGALEQGSDEMDAILARMSSAGAELKVDAGRLALVPVREALALAVDVAVELKSVEADLKGVAKKDVAARVARVIKAVETLRGKLGEAVV